MRDLILAMSMLFLSTFFFVVEDASAHEYVEPTWVEDIDRGIVCSIDSSYLYAIDVMEKDESKNKQKRIKVFPMGTSIAQAIFVRSAMMGDLKFIREWYRGNNVLVFDIKILSRSSECEMAAKRNNFVQQKTEP